MVTHGIKTLPERQRTGSNGDTGRRVLATDNVRIQTIKEASPAEAEAVRLPDLAPLDTKRDVDDEAMLLSTSETTEIEAVAEKPVPPARRRRKKSGINILPGQRRCPEIADSESERPLLIQTIDGSTCDKRQHEGYHKCASCIHMKRASFRGNGLPPLDNCPSQLAESRLADLQRPKLGKS